MISKKLNYANNKQIMFKKRPEDDELETSRNPLLKDFHMDPEHRKFLFAETYCSGVAGSEEDMTVKQYALHMEQQQQRLAMEQLDQRFVATAAPSAVFANKDGTNNYDFKKVHKNINFQLYF